MTRACRGAVVIAGFGLRAWAKRRGRSRSHAFKTFASTRWLLAATVAGAESCTPAPLEFAADSGTAGDVSHDGAGGTSAAGGAAGSAGKAGGAGTGSALCASEGPASGEWCVIDEAAAPAPRRRPTGGLGAWTGTELVVWGGADASDNVFADGARYRPATDSWAAMSATGKPSARAGHVLAAAAGRVIVWGGGTLGAAYFADGRIYDPVSDAWSPMAAPGLAARDLAAFAASADRVYVWGGCLGGGQAAGDGAIYDPIGDGWTALPAGNAPAARCSPTSAATDLNGNTLFMLTGGVGPWGSNVIHGDGGSLLEGGSGWLNLDLAPLAPRFDHTLVVAPAGAIVWGGRTSFDGLEVTGDGARRAIGSAQWIALSGVNAPPPRAGHAAVWTGSKMLVWGGCDGTHCFADGALYDVSANAWTPLPPAPLEPRAPAAAVWTGTELIVWGGCDLQKRCFRNGARFRP